MLTLDGAQVFWIFTLIMFIFLCLAVISARLISPKKPNKIKNTIYECGQDPFGEANEFRILGIAKYFGYSVVFFALDAFAWVLLTSALSVSISLEIISVIVIYSLVIFGGVAYFLIEKNKLV